MDRSFIGGENSMVTNIIVGVAIVVVLLANLGLLPFPTASAPDVWLTLKDKGVVFNCNTDSQCFRDCMDLIDDAEECERGLMEGGR